MHVVGNLTVAQIDSDRVSGDCFERNWHSGVERLVVSGNVVGKTVYCRDHAAVRDGKDGLFISIIRLLIPRVSRERDPIFDLLPVDGVPSGNYGAAIDNQDPAPMMIVGIIARAVGCEPIRSFQWWPQHTQRGVTRYDHRASGGGFGRNQ